jgi:glycosyltransferase involved in cell wall biosynthesis
MVLLEAASYGMTLVGYDCSDGVRSLIKDRYNGYTIEPGNIIDFAKKLKHLIKNDNLISTMGNNSVIIAQDYSLERIVQQWVQLFA